jgi:hypothetical protein
VAAINIKRFSRLNPRKQRLSRVVVDKVYLESNSLLLGPSSALTDLGQVA